MSRLKDHLRQILTLDPAAPEMEFDKVWSSWGDISRQADRIDAALTEAGLGAGTRVAVLLRNRPEMVPTIIALLRSERCLVTLNAFSPDDKLEAEIVSLGAPVIIGLDDDLARPAIRAGMNAANMLGLSLPRGLTNAPSLEGVPGAAKDQPRATAPGMAIEMLSSGTTGTPKRIPLSYKNFERALFAAAAFEKGRAEDDAPRLRGGVQIITAPFAHIAGITGLMNSIVAGRKFCLIEKFTVEGFRDAVSRHRPKVAGAPPSALRMIYDAGVPKEDLSSLLAFRTGTAPIEPDLIDAIVERYGIPVLQNYGATEFAGGVAGWTIDDFKAFWKSKHGSVGRLNKGIEGRIVSLDGDEVLAPGQLGVLEVRAAHLGDGTSRIAKEELLFTKLNPRSH